MKLQGVLKPKPTVLIESMSVDEYSRILNKVYNLDDDSESSSALETKQSSASLSGETESVSSEVSDSNLETHQISLGITGVKIVDRSTKRVYEDTPSYMRSLTKRTKFRAASSIQVTGPRIKRYERPVLSKKKEYKNLKQVCSFKQYNSEKLTCSPYTSICTQVGLFVFNHDES